MRKVQDILRRVGPGLITASVVLGPGSISSASNAGATVGYQLLWVLVCAGLFMAVYTAMGARLGCALEETPLEHIAKRYGRWLAVLTGFSGFFVCAGFQFGNNLGVSDAMYGLFGGPEWLKIVWPIVFTSLAILFLFSVKQFYRLLERMMMVLVAVMIIAFVTNLFWTGIDVPRLASGLVPRVSTLRGGGILTAGAWMATTFSVVAAFYQAYLVRAKGWKRENVRVAIGDAWIGIGILALISAVIMIGAAETLGGTKVSNIGQLAQQLRFLGPVANIVFCCGLAAAAFSSFVVNAMVGGNLLADGLGLDARVDSKQTRILAAAALGVGCLVALISKQFDSGSLYSLLIAQASTLIAAPLSGILLLMLTCSKKTMGDLKTKAVSLVIGVVGLAVIFALVYRTITKLPGIVSAITGG